MKRLQLGLGALVAALAGCNPSVQVDDDTSTSETGPPPPDLPDEPEGECGNGVVEPGEDCDDGNELEEDGCNSSCEVVDPMEIETMDLVRGGTCLTYGQGSLRCWIEPAGAMGAPFGSIGTGAGIGDISGPPIRSVALRGGIHYLVGTDGTLYGIGDGDGWHSGVGGANGGGDGSSLVDAFTIPLDEPAVEVELGLEHACVILESGAVRCWGHNHMGKLGLGTTLDFHEQFGIDFGYLGDDESMLDYPPVDLPRPAVQLALGSQHTCALLDDGAVYCWGANESRERWSPYEYLGQNGMIGTGLPGTVGLNETPGEAGPVSLGGKATEIFADNWRTCALLDNGDARCWGDGRHGYPEELFDEFPADVGDDELPSDFPPLNPDERAIISIGLAHSCIVLEDGAVRCLTIGEFAGEWDGYTTYANRPDVEMGGPAVRMWSGLTTGGEGGGHVCALLEDKTLRCMGSNYAGALGYGPALQDQGLLKITPEQMGPVPWKDAW